MYLNNKILAIIPARGGSKGLRGKNIKLLHEKPLISWTIEQAKASKYIDEIFVSTDSMEIADAVKTFDITIPFLRPPEIARDDSPSSEFILHTIEYYKGIDISFDYIVLLEPTSPLRKPSDIDDAITTLFSNNQADGVVSVGKVHLEHPQIVKKIDENGFLQKYIKGDVNITQRQMTDAAYFPYGVIYMIKTALFLETHSFYSGKIVPYFLERWQNYEIDDIYDFIAIEAILKHQIK